MARVVVTGGGYGGIIVAKSFDLIAEVVLVGQKDRFARHTVALCTVVDEVWEQTTFMPYTNLLTRGRFVYGTVSHAEGTTAHVYGYDLIETDYLVFATDSTYPFPVECSSLNSAVMRARLVQLHEDFKGARSMMPVGGGMVGIEFAGEFAHTFLGMEIIIVEKEDTILFSPGYSEELHEETPVQFAELGMHMITGSELTFPPPHNVGGLGHFQALILGSEQIEGDIWFQCYGVVANMGYSHGTDYEELLYPNGTLRVKKSLQVVDHRRSYVVGDLTDVRESKRTDVARQQARVVIANLSALIAGEPPEAVYEPTKEWVILPLGLNMGTLQPVDAEGVLRIIGVDQTMEIRGADLMVPVIRSQPNLP